MGSGSLGSGSPGPESRGSGGARPARARRVLDLRIVVGLLLVAASVAGVVAVVSAADRRVAVYAAAGPLVPGDRIDARDLVERRVVLDGGEGAYLAPGDIPDEGTVVLRPVAAGELVPLAATGDRAGLRATAVVLRLSAPVGSSIEPGAVVDVWASRAAPGFGADAVASPPVVLASDAVVVRVAAEDGLVAASQTTVEVLVPRTRVARLLQAIADGDALAIVPASLPLPAR